MTAVWRNEAGSGQWILGDAETLNASFGRAVASSPDQLFVDCSGEQYTYAEFDQESARIARGLRDLGVGAGDPVNVILDNGPDALLTWFAINRLGAIYVPLNTALKGDFLQHQLADTGASVVVAESDYADRVLELDDAPPALRFLLHRGMAPGGAAGGLKVSSLDEFRLDGDDDPTQRLDPSAPASVIFTGGTTGPSKGCVVSHAYIVRLGRAAVWMAGRTSDELNWNPCPLFHLNSMSSVIGTLLIGGSCSIAPRFSVTNFWPEIERTGARIVNLLGTMIPLVAGMADTEEMARCRGQIRAVIGAPFTPATEAAWRDRFGVELVGNPFYGLSECAPLAMATLAEPKPPGACGRSADDVDMRIFDDEDRELPPGEVGEIVCRPRRANVMFDGYWRRPEATTAITKNLWLHTGDLGRVDADGWLYFVDRKKDYLRRGGENISSVELEAALLKHPALAEVAVHAVFSELSEDEVKLTAVLAPEAELTEEELCLWSAERVPYFAVPRFIEFRTTLPKNPVGRILKYELRDEGVTATTWDRVAAGVLLQRR